MSIVVSKFGGTSMADAQAMIRSSKITIERNASIMVVSATSGTTNELLELIELALTDSWDQTKIKLESLKNKHLSIAEELSASEDTYFELNELTNELDSLIKGINLLKDCSPKAKDRVLSFGERLSSRLCSYALQKVINEKGLDLTAQFFDVRNVMTTDDEYGTARPNFDQIKVHAQNHKEKILTGNIIYVTQGFIGINEDGHTTTLGRGGSDYSAAILAEAFDADLLEIWTDVAGIATTDPRIYQNAKQIEEISFKEASELASFGAKILHPTTLLPCQRSNIPVFVGSSYAPQDNGTWIRKQTENNPLVRGIALKKNQVLLTISTPEMLNAHGFLYQIFEVFNRHKVSVDSITTSEISIALTLDNNQIINRKLVRDLELFSQVKIEQHLSLVSIIGNQINHTPGFTNQLFSTLEDIQIRMICAGASKHNFCFLVKEKDGENAVRKIHEKLLG